MSRNGEDSDTSRPDGSPADTTKQQQVGSDSQDRNASTTLPNDQAGANLAFEGYGSVGQGAAGHMNPNQQYLEEQQRRLMMLEQAQMNQRNMLLRQGDYGQLSGHQLALRNQQFMNQQMLLNQSNALPFMMDPLLSAAGSQPQMGPSVNPEMFFGSGANPWHQAPSIPGFPQHAAGNFPSMHQQQLHAMSQMSNIMHGASRADVPDMAGHAASAQRRADNAAAAAVAKGKKDTPPQNLPLRPLSAYNFFFRDERERIIQGDNDKEADDSPESPEKKKRRLLDEHILRDRTRRRPHRKTHGKIGFTTLSKLVGERWRELPEDKKQFYRDVAAMDMDRYQRDVNAYNKRSLLLGDDTEQDV